MAPSLPPDALSLDPALALAGPEPDPLAFLAYLSEEFASAEDLEQSVSRALEGIVKLLHVEAGALFLLDETGQRLVCRACVGEKELCQESLPAAPYRIHNSRQAATSIAASAAEETVPVLDRASGPAGAVIIGDRLRVPLTVGERLLGLMEIKQSLGAVLAVQERDVHLLRAVTSAAALALSSARMADMLVEREGVRRELEIAAEIQRSQLPPPVAKGFPVQGVNRPARRVSGDFYDFFTLDSEKTTLPKPPGRQEEDTENSASSTSSVPPSAKVAFALGDVSGKGINAALLMARTASLFRCLGKNLGQPGWDPGYLLGLINREISEVTSRGMFVTLILGIYDQERDLVWFANAGHEPPMVLQPGRRAASFPADAPPVGIDPALVYRTQEINLAGGALYVFSDGITETEDIDGRALGRNGLEALLTEQADQPLDQRLPSVLETLCRRCPEQRDDLTLLGVEAIPEPGRTASIDNGTVA